MRNLFKKALPLILLAVLALLTGFGETLESVTQQHDWHQTARSTIAWLVPIGKHLLTAGIVAYLAVLSFSRCREWVSVFVKLQIPIPRVQEIAQSSFPLIYGVAAFIAVAYALDNTIFMYAGAVLMGIGYITKDELSDFVDGIIIQLTAKTEDGGRVSVEGKQGTVLQIGILFSRIALDGGGELRINNRDFWVKMIVIDPPEPVTPTAGDATTRAT